MQVSFLILLGFFFGVLEDICTDKGPFSVFFFCDDDPSLK